MELKSNNYITTLTPLRGIAALLVVVYHSNLIVNPFLNPKYSHFIAMGYLWVDFFFILSGFILSYVYGHKFRSSVRREEYWKYIASRFARIYPLHFFTLIWALICALIIREMSDKLHPWFDELFNPKAAPSSLLMIHSLNLYNVPPLNSPSWSLSTEWWVYMLFPFFVPLFSRIRAFHRFFILLAIVVGYLLLMYVLGPNSGPFKGFPKLDVVADFGIFRCFVGFFLGMLVHDVYKKRKWKSLLQKDILFISLALVIAIAMHFGINDLLIVAVFPVVILCAAYNQSRVKKILDWDVLQKVGEWSFSIYMVHIPIVYIYNIYQLYQNPKIFSDFFYTMRLGQNGKMGVVLCICLLATTLWIASLTYKYIEVPCRKYLVKLFEGKTANREKRDEREKVVPKAVEV